MESTSTPGELHPTAFGAGAPLGAPRSTAVRRALKVEIDNEIRCQGKVAIRTRPGENKVCGKLLAERAGRPWQIKCSRCGTVNRSADPGVGPPPQSTD